MKKFLTVLLALSVVFTYSFSAVGSVFAAEATPELDAAKATALAKLEANYNSANKAFEDDSHVYTVEGTPYAVTRYASALKEVATKVYNDYKEVIQKQYEQAKADSSITPDTAFTSANTVASIDYLGLKNVSYDSVDTYDEFVAVVKGEDTAGLYQSTLFDALLPYTKAYVLGELDKVDLGAYSDDVMDKDDPFKTTYAEKAAEVVNGAKKAINDMNFTADTSDKDKAAELTRMVSAIASITAFKADGSVASTSTIQEWAYILVDGTKVSLNPSEGYTTIDGEKIATKYLIKGIEKLETAEALKAEAATETAQRAAYKAYVEKKYAEKYAEYLEAGMSKDNLAKAVENLDKYKAVALAIVAEAPLNDAKRWGTDGEFDAQLNAAPGKYDVYADAEKRAEVFKLTTDKTGELIYDAAVIDENMKDIKMQVYFDGKLSVADRDITANATIAADTFAWDKEVALAQNEVARENALGDEDKYYAPEKDAINKLFDERAEKINACTTSAQIAKVTKDSVTIPSTVKTAAAIVSEFETALGAGLSTEFSLAKKYIEVKNGSKLSNDPSRIAIDDNYLKTLMAETFAENGARTNTAAKALMEKVYAAIDAYPTQGEQSTNVEAVQAAIDALPSTITVADKATVQAAFDLYTALTAQEQAKVKEARLNSAIAVLKSLAEKEIDDAIKALPAKLTAADKAAVEAVQKLVDAYEDETMWTAKTYDLSNKFADVREAEKKDVIEAIYKLGTNPTVEAVEAARKAYDAYVAYWTDASAAPNGYNAAKDIVNDSTLFYAEAQVKANIIKATEGLKISVSTKLYKGSKIRVSWKIKGGDASYIDGYQVWKSKKAQSGYSIMGKTTKSYMDNKKGLKKGTRYYYKVRAYVEIDGVKYYSDWSNKGNRIYK